MRPSLTGTRPATSASSVDLPQPEGPTIDTNSPPRTSKETRSTAVNSRFSRGSENRCVTCSRTIAPVGTVVGFYPGPPRS